MEESLARIDAAAVAFFQHHSAEAHALLLSIELDVPLFSQMLVVRCFSAARLHWWCGCGLLAVWLGSWLCVFAWWGWLCVLHCGVAGVLHCGHGCVLQHSP